MYEAIGGQTVIDQLVDDFYEIMRSEPLAKDCLATHFGKDMEDSAHKLKFFLSGWLGGPQLYLNKFGPPRLRMRHHAFPIGHKQAEQWLLCMKIALEKSPIDKDVQNQMMGAFSQVAQMLIKNQF